MITHQDHAPLLDATQLLQISRAIRDMQHFIWGMYNTHQEASGSAMGYGKA